ncbi:OmpA family protein [Flavicella marina]|uniref:OmpA family protein n=1 Tax=Flavicella marina TaxID=1475951 RepID=UPI001265658F|nr:OmpA family protein [Flavicella marina]
MIKKISLGIIVAMVTVSCVSKKVFTDLEGKYKQLQDENKELLVQNDDLQLNKNENKDYIKKLENKQTDLLQKEKALQREADALRNSYAELKKTYDLLASKSSSALEKNAVENRKLLSQLDEKETKLLEEGARLRKLENELSERSSRIDELEKLIAEKEAAMQQLKTTVANALKGFEGKGLTVVNKNGKVYVSMENKLLFSSGSWAVGENGANAVKKLARVLANNPDISVLIEGHTDNDPFHGPVIKDNWDLSVKRATAIVRILEDANVDAKQITAAGKGEYVPVASNNSKEGKAKNRRIEIILSPNLDEIAKLLTE